MKSGVRYNIGRMVVASIIIAAIFAVAGLLVGLFWFSNEARPAIRTIRDASAWTGKFYLMYFVGCGFSCVYSILAALVFGYKRVDWAINTVVTTIVGLILTAIMYIVFPTKDASINITSAVFIFLQGFGIYFIASLFAPESWVYNPAKG